MVGVQADRDELSMSSARTESKWIRIVLIGVALTYLFVVVFLPLIIVFTTALKKGVSVYFSSLTDVNTIAAIQLTISNEETGTTYIHLSKEQCKELSVVLNECFDYNKHPSE